MIRIETDGLANPYFGFLGSPGKRENFAHDADRAVVVGIEGEPTLLMSDRERNVSSQFPTRDRRDSFGLAAGG
jgi:hypothetical protein